VAVPRFDDKVALITGAGYITGTTLLVDGGATMAPIVQFKGGL
jgi:hypothetical protein